MREPLPILLAPGLACSPRLFAEQIPVLWRFGPVMIADHTRASDLKAVARQILDAAPPRFALVGLSMGGYVAFEIMRQAGGRVARLALLDTSALPDAPEQSRRRRDQIALAESGRFSEIPDLLFPNLVHPDRLNDATLRGTVRRMAEETGAEAFARQLTAIMNRSDSRPDLAAIQCPTLVLAGDADAITPPDRAREIAEGIGGAQTVIIKECGHLSTLERPGDVTNALVEWMNNSGD